MPNWWLAVMFRLSAIILSVILALAGTALRKPKLGLVSATLPLPFSAYLTGTANCMALADPAIPAALSGSAYAIHRRTFRLA